MAVLRLPSLLFAACVALAWMVGSAPASAQTNEAAQTQLERDTCRNGRGTANACNNYGARLDNGTGVTRDRRTGLRFFRMACDMGDMRACENVGLVTTGPDSVQPNDAESNRFLRRACDGGWSSSCKRMGYRLRDGTHSLTVDLAGALRAFEATCNLRDGEGCFEASFFYLNAQGVAQDDAAALRLYQQSCGLNFNKGCSQLAFMAYSGRGMAVDLNMAVRNYRRACGGGSPVACSVVEQMRSAGPGGYGYAELMAAEADGFPSNATAEQRYVLASAALANGETARALPALNTLSQEGLADADFTLGQIYYNGQGVAVDRRLAIRHFERAASGRHPYAMYLLGQMNWYAMDMNWNPTWGIAMMRGAEEAGLAEAGPIWRQWQAERDAYFDGRDAANRQMAIDNERSQSAADAANMQRIWGLYSNSQNRQENGQVCGTIYRNNQAHHECMARETFDTYYNPNR